MSAVATRDRSAAALAGVLERLPRRRPTLAVLTYHRVAPAAERPDLHPGLRVDPAAFAAQLEVLRRVAQPVSCDDLLAARAGTRALPARAVHVTIDDGYGCTARHAWPALQRAHVPATLFVPTAHPAGGRTFWWDRLHHALASTDAPSVRAGGRSWATGDAEEVARTFAALRAEVASRTPHEDGLALVDEVTEAAGVEPPEPDVVDWAGLARMGAEGLALAPHSRTHPLLDRTPDDRLDDEIGGSWADLVAAVGPAARPVFAPPGGGTDARVRAACHRAGLHVVMTTDRGVNDGTAPSWDALTRINVGPRATTGLVRVQLLRETHRARAGAHAARARVRPTHPARGGRSWS